MAIITKTSNGWKKWANIDTTPSVDGASDVIPFSEFPPLYLPANGCWTQMFSVNCALPGPIQTGDGFSNFLTGGGATSTLMGAIGGLASANAAFGFSNSVSYGIAGRAKNMGPRMGYCIGDIFKDYLYIKATMLDAGFGVGVSEVEQEVHQYSKLKRIYVHHGEISNFQYNTQTEENTIKLDTFFYLKVFQI